MSRDWRPFEAVIADEQAHMSRGEYIHDAKITMYFKGVDKPMYNEEARGPFPNLCYLLEGFELRIYDAIKDDPKKYAFYEQLEADVKQLSDTIRSQMQADKRLCLDDVKVDPTIRDWFMGELDPNFYYREDNNEAFMDWIDKQLTKDEVIELDDVLFYAEKHEAENLYCLLYYNFIDANESHISWRIMPQIDSWSEEETLEQCRDLICDIMMQNSLDSNTLTERYIFPKSVKNALDKVLDLIDRDNIPKDNIEEIERD